MDDLEKFLRTFDAHISKELEMIQLVNPKPIRMVNLNPMDTATFQIERQRQKGYQITISERNLARLIDMIKNKGYYHDDEYDKRMREEDLILSHPDLKRMHDQYKMYLYLLCGDRYDEP